ncbi:MAG: hypothetical protein P8X86_20110 [Desulfofustis sp.]|jgi:uncharacterized membrane protein
MSNAITGGIAVLMALVYLLYYAIRLKSPVLWIIIVINLCALLYDYYNGITQGEDMI